MAQQNALDSSNKYEAITAMKTATNAPQKSISMIFEKEIPFRIKRQNLRKFELTQWHEHGRVHVCFCGGRVLTIINIRKRNKRTTEKKIEFFLQFDGVSER